MNYKTHVIRQIYTSNPEDTDSEIEAHEKAWLEYKDFLSLNNLPSMLRTTTRTYMSDQTKEDKTPRHGEGKTWLYKHLHEYVEQLQMMKQHQVHLRNLDTNIREPAGACRRKDNPK